MNEAVRKASTLIEALGWIRRFQGKYVVIKLGGSALDETAAVSCLLTDAIFMGTVGVRPIIVHGGGREISQAMSESGIEPRFVQGRRYTDAKTLDIVSRVLVDEICESLVAEVRRQGGNARGLHFQTDYCLLGERLQLSGDDGELIDLGHVGRVTDLRRDLLMQVCSEGVIPIIPSIAVDADGGRLNVNADTAAAAVAGILNAEKLVFLSDVPGILTNPEDPASLLSRIESADCHNLIGDGVICSGMIPKVEAALAALADGVSKVHIVDGRMPHSLLLEIYSNEGVGTELVQ